MKVELKNVAVHVDGHFWRSGSVLNDTIEAGCDKLVIHFEVESDEDPALIAAVLSIVGWIIALEFPRADRCRRKG